MNIIKTQTKEDLEKLRNDSALTIEGLSEDSIQDFLNWIQELTPLKNDNIYITSGKTMNNIYYLTGSNAYPDDCTIVSVMLSDMENPMSVALPRFQIGGRWFDDIVANNVRKENES